MLDKNQISMVKRSWASLDDLDLVASLFYKNLFQLDPALKGLFPEDLKDQKKKLMDMISLAVGSLDRIEDLVPAIKNMGKRHIDYGVDQEDYVTVGQALLITLEMGLDRAFTPDLREAWTLTYTILSKTMMTAYEDFTPIQESSSMEMNPT